MAELKPCPFCGGVPCIDTHSFYDERTKDFTDHTYGVVCTNCNAQTSQHYLTKAQAKGAWNTRTPKECHCKPTNHETLEDIQTRNEVFEL